MLSSNWIENIVNDKILNLHTAFLAEVKTVDGDTAKVQPLQNYRMAAGNAAAQEVVTVLVPQNIKYHIETIEYMTGAAAATTVTESHSAVTILQPETEKIEVCVPDELSAGDLVVCIVCERDITNAKKGLTEQPTNRHHDMNDSVIIRVL